MALDHTSTPTVSRVLEDGSRWQVYKRWFDGQGLADELGGGEVLFAGDWFVLVRASF